MMGGDDVCDGADVLGLDGPPRWVMDRAIPRIATMSNQASQEGLLRFRGSDGAALGGLGGGGGDVAVLGCASSSRGLGGVIRIPAPA